MLTKMNHSLNTFNHYKQKKLSTFSAIYRQICLQLLDDWDNLYNETILKNSSFCIECFLNKYTKFKWLNISMSNRMTKINILINSEVIEAYLPFKLSTW